MRLRLATAVLLAVTPAFAQTSMGQTPMGAVPSRSLASPVPTTPPVPGGAPSSKVTTLGPVAAAPAPQFSPDAPPLPDSVYRQAMDQADGHFPPLDRTGGGGQIQTSWNLSEPRDGVYATRICTDCVYKVRTREFMTTTLILPDDAEITGADLGDATGFKVQVRPPNQVAVRPSSYGLDTNLNVTTRSGAVYPFYIRAEGINSQYVPDLVVRLLGRERPEEVVIPPPVASKPGKEAAAVYDPANPKPPASDFARTIPFDPAKLRGWHDYKLWGEDDLRPEVVYRDDVFTYIRYGDKWDGMELSAAYVTIDGIDELVNSRVQGSTFIVESVNPLITLKNGKKFLCLQYGGKP